MKCIRKNKENSKILRVKDSEAFRRIDSGEYIFVPKNEWKEQEKNKK